MNTFKTIDDIKKANIRNGGHWFDAASLRIFQARVGRVVYGGKYFISSEKSDDASPRKYTIRVAKPDGLIDTVGEFQAYDSPSQARAAIRRILASDLTTPKSVLVLSSQTTTTLRGDTTMFNTITEIKNANAANGYHWFKTPTMGFFGSHTGRTVYGGKYFISSEQFDDASPRKYTIRVASPDGAIDTVGEFQAYDTASQARAAIRRILASDLTT